ncbi:MAG: 2-oxoglutarate dehydrogenase E2 component (dihydrolipoamide succinyltransferase) [Alphaproteobacteria bacterium]|jgi:2-oxoglutarate dehydrogenase E2 component (dihydrolipoamide succinyltransferase)
MSVEVKVPQMGESVTEGTIANWNKNVGDSVAADELLVEIETDKVTMEVNAPSAGILAEITAQSGDTVEIGALLGVISTDGAAVVSQKSANNNAEAEAKQETQSEPVKPVENSTKSNIAMPSATTTAANKNIDLSTVSGTGRDGRILKEDVLRSANNIQTASPASKPQNRPETGGEERVKMTRLRQTIAKRLKSAQENAALLTTFNEIDMTNVMGLRNEYKETFEKKHGCRLGFMSFFIKAVVNALQEIPAVNAEIDGTDIIYKNYYNIGVAVGSPNGLVVPVVRNCESLSFSQIEQTITNYGRAARDGKLSMADMQGGTFTVSNGGVYGSLMSTPIINPPQSGILGMHKVQQRPMVMPDGSIQARPMMYLALSYDHRIIDGKEAVTFLVRVKENLEDPRRLLLDL